MALKTFNDYRPRFSEVLYKMMMKAAGASNPIPDQSKFFVHTAAMNTKRKIYCGGNTEFAICDGIHGEESAVANALDDEPKSKIEIVAFTNHGEAPEVPRHCGNCRDYLMRYASKNAETVEGSLKGDILVVPFWNTYIVENFMAADNFRFLSDHHDAIQQANIALKRSYDIYARQKGRDMLYGAALITTEGLFRGSYDGDAAFDPVLPIKASIINMKNSHVSRDAFNIEGLVVVARSRPKVLYKDRQSLLELQEQFSDKPIEVILANVDETNKIRRVWRTDSNEWLPYAFGPASLGMKGKMDEYKVKLM